MVENVALRTARVSQSKIQDTQRAQVNIPTRRGERERENFATSKKIHFSVNFLYDACSNLGPTK